jgi:hypothetical protein
MLTLSNHHLRSKELLNETVKSDGGDFLSSKMYTNTSSKVQVINQAGGSLTYSYENIPENFIKTTNSFYHHENQKEEAKIPENSTSSKFYLTSKNKVLNKIPK